MATAWVVTPGMKTVQTAFNQAFPNRDKTSDGTIGDLAHQNESASSHNPDITGRAEWKDGDSKNEVRAVDIDSDLRDASGYGITMEVVVQHLVALGRAGKLAAYVRYLIYNKRIWSASDGWVTRTYTGASAHTEHLHVTGAFTQAADENTKNVYALGDLMALSSGDKTWIENTVKNGTAAVLGGILGIKVGDKAYPARTIGDVLRDEAKLRGYLVGDVADTKNAAIPAGVPVDQIVKAAQDTLNASGAVKA